MAQQTTVTYLDDIDGSKATETISFALDGAHYEIDVNAKNAKNLRKTLAEFVGAARHVKAADSGVGRAAGGKTVGRRRGSDKDDSAAVRAWAEDNGVPIAARGRIAESVRQQYLTATAESTA